MWGFINNGCDDDDWGCKKKKTQLRMPIISKNYKHEQAAHKAHTKIASKKKENLKKTTTTEQYLKNGRKTKYNKKPPSLYVIHVNCNFERKRK